MKNVRFNLIAAAATLIAATSTASAQSTLNANVPFAFQINSGTALPAGDYTVLRVHGNAQVWQFEDRSTGHKTMVALGQIAGSRSGDPAKLEFKCRAENCALIKIQVGNGDTGYEIRAPKPKGPAEEARLVIVPLTRASAE
jgi:hypothetical protein